MNYNSLKELVAIDSPSGYTHEACEYAFNLLKSYGYQPEITNKGVVKCALGKNPILGIAAHVDTLGGIVSKVNKDGTLRLSKIGGLQLNGYEGSYCRIRTLDDKVFTGTFLLDNPASHANRDVNKAQRSLANMHIRLDEVVNNDADIKALGIRVGDFICFDTNYQETESGFIKSRYMDNKAGCFVLFEIAKRAAEEKLDVPVELFFSTYEEVGHGGTCGFSDTIKELLVIDMGVIGDDCTGKETTCSICAKDSTGPYDYRFRKSLVQIAEKENIAYSIDVYPYYGSDGSAALRAGNDFRVALIGPGVSASHGVERTHKKGIEATIDLCMGYIEHAFVTEKGISSRYKMSNQIVG